MCRIYNRKIPFFYLRLGHVPKIEQNFIFYFLKIVRLFRQDIVKVGSRNVPRPRKQLRAGLGNTTSPEPAIPGPARSYLVLLCSGGGDLLYDSGSRYVNNSVRRVVGVDIRVGFGLSGWHQFEPAPAMYRIYNRGKIRFSIFGFLMNLN